MPKQMGLNPIIGTYGNQTFYYANGEYLVKKKNNYNVNLSKARGYHRYKANIKTFGDCSKIAKAVYQHLEMDQRRHGLFGEMTAMVRRMVKENVPIKEIKKQLTKKYLPGSSE
jgi:hypothetical protein